MGCLSGIILALTIAAVKGSGDGEVPLPYAAAAATYESLPQASHSRSHDDGTSHSPHGTYLKQYGGGPEGYQVQSGFEGYIVPAMATAYGLTHQTHEIEEPSGVVYALMSHVQPFIGVVLEFLPKVAFGALVGVLLLVVGTLVTSSLCAFTPLCHMSFMGVNLTRESVRGFITQERISEAASLLQSAIKKYQQLNSKKKIEPVTSNEVKK